MPPLIAPEHDAGRGPGQRLTVSLSLIDGLGSLGWLVWLEFTGQNTGEDRAAERASSGNVLNSYRSTHPIKGGNHPTLVKEHSLVLSIHTGGTCLVPQARLEKRMTHRYPVEHIEAPCFIGRDYYSRYA